MISKAVIVKRLFCSLRQPRQQMPIAINNSFLFSPAPALHLLLKSNGLINIRKNLIEHQLKRPAFVGVTGRVITRLMLVKTPLNIIGHAGIIRPVAAQ